MKKVFFLIFGNKVILFSVLSVVLFGSCTKNELEISILDIDHTEFLSKPHSNSFIDHPDFSGVYDSSRDLVVIKDFGLNQNYVNFEFYRNYSMERFCPKKFFNEDTLFVYFQPIDGYFVSEPLDLVKVAKFKFSIVYTDPIKQIFLVFDNSPLLGNNKINWKELSYEIMNKDNYR